MQYARVMHLKSTSKIPQTQAAKEIHSVPKVSGSSLSLLPLSLSPLGSAGREAIGRIFPSHFMRTFSEFPTSVEPRHIHQLSRRLSPVSAFMLERSEEARSKYLPCKRNVRPLKSICTHLPQIYSPTTLVRATGGQSCAMETCGIEHWGTLIHRHRVCVCGTLHTPRENLFQLPRC